MKKEKILQSLKPTKAKIIPLIILFILLNYFIFIFNQRLSLDCFGPDCDYGELMKEKIELEHSITMFLNVFVVLPIIIILYLMLTVINHIWMGKK